MNKNKSSSNKISIVIAIVAVILILGGVYLLNESFNSSENSGSKSTSSNVADSVTYSVIDDGSETVDDSKSVELFSENSQKGDLSKSNLVNDTKEDVVVKEDEKTTEKTVATSEEKDSDKTDKDDDDIEEKKDLTNEEGVEEDVNKEVKTETVTLEDNQVLAKIVSTDGFNSEIEIIECGIPNATVCVPGGELQLRALQEYTDIEVDESYVLTGNIYEADGYIYVDTLDSVEGV